MKTSIEQLAVLGGKPQFERPLHVGRPNVPDPDAVIAQVRGALDRNWLTNDGPLVRELETKLAGYLAVPHCVAMCNATVALEVLARALGLTGEVVMPAFTFVATAHAFSWLGLDPVFCDIDPDTHNIDAKAAERRITQRTSAIVGVHLWGRACNVSELERLAAHHGLPLIYDAAHAFGSSVGHQRIGSFGTAEVFSFHATKFFNTFEGGAITTKDAALAAHHGLPLIYDAAHAFGSSVGHQRIGSFGTAEVFSFHATKFFNTFEGGAITTKDAALAERLRLMRNFGFAGYDDVVSVGTNAKMSEAHAAMGLTLFGHLDQLLQSNVETWISYNDGLRGINGLRLLRPQDGYGSNYQYVVLEVDAACGLTRDQLLNVLWQENVRARRYFFPGLHRTQPYIARGAAQLPVTERVAERVLVLPAGAAITRSEIAQVIQLIRFALDHASTLSGRLPKSMQPGAFKA